MKKFWAWLLLSSEDPNQASLMVKAGLSAAVTYIVFFTGLFHRGANASEIQVAFDQIGALVGAVLMVIHSVRAIWGATKKIIKTFSGTNEVLNQGVTL